MHNIWYFGSHAGLNFNTTPPTPLSNGQTYVTAHPYNGHQRAYLEGVSSISDPINGNILFYTDGKNVWKNNHQLLGITEAVDETYSTAQSSLILPTEDPNIFSVLVQDTEIGDFGGDLYLYRLDISNYSLTLVQDITGVNAYGCIEGLTAIKHQHGYYVISHSEDDNNFRVFKLNSDGSMWYGFLNIMQSRGYSENNFQSYLKASKDGTLLAYAPTPDRIEIYKFDKVTGLLSNIPNTITVNLGNSTKKIYALEFSPNNKYLYATERYTGRLHQINIQNLYNLTDNVVSCDNESLYLKGLQMGPNGKLYVSLHQCDLSTCGGGYTSPYGKIIEIDNPNSAITTSDLHYLNLAAGTFGSEGLPNFIDFNCFDFILSQQGCQVPNININMQFLNTNYAYTYTWNTGAHTQGLTNVIPGNTYSVTVSNGSCDVVKEITVSNGLNDMHIEFDITPLECPNSIFGGEISALANGGTQPYNYQWSTGGIGQNIYNVPIGNYSVTVTDVNGCTSAANTYLPIADSLLNVNISSNEASCLNNCDGSIIADITCNNGGPNSFSYTFNGSNWYGANCQNGNVLAQNLNLCPGNYNLQIDYAIPNHPGNSCSQSYNIVVEQNMSAFTFDYNVTNTMCPELSDGSIIISNIGGTSPFTFEWSNGATTQNISNLSAGEYSVVITDANGCKSSKTIEIGENNDPCDCYPGETLLPANYYSINTNMTLPVGEYVVEEDIYLNTNGVLNLNGCILNFRPGKTLYVARGAILNINNSTLTTICGEMWKGIKSSGTASFANTYPTINISNNSVIENAETGILFDGTVKLIANNSSFVNNHIDLQRAGKGTDYDFINYYSKFIITNCEFKTTSLLLGPTYTTPLYHVYLSNCSNTKFEYCNFKNQRAFSLDSYGSTIVNNRGYGIYAVKSDIISLKNCTFEKLYYGIYQKDDNTFGGTTKIELNNFIDNFRAMYIYNKKNTHHITVNNDINVWDRYVYAQTYWNGQNYSGWGYGAYLNNCDAYDFRGNNFYAGNVEEKAIVGMYVNNSGSDDNLVYNNTFRDFSSSNGVGKSTAIIVMGNNGETQVGGTGLQIKCNDFGQLNNASQKNSYDIANIYTNTTVKEKQGYYSNSIVTAPANNRFFDHYGTVGDNAYYSSASQVFNYYVYNAIDNNYTDFDDCRTTSKVLRQNNSISTVFVKAEACPEVPNTGGGGIVIGGGLGESGNSFFTEFSNYLNDYNSQISTIKNDLQTEVDNGNTIALEINVETANSSTYDAINRKIAETNGYVSDNVVLEYLKTDLNRPISKTLTLKKISPLPAVAKAEIDNTELSDGLKNYLKNYQSGTNVREQKQNEIGKIRSNKQWLINYAINEVNALENNREELLELINILNNNEDLFSQTKVYNLLVQTNNLNDANLKLNDIASLTNTMEQKEAENINNWVELQKIVLKIEELNTQIFDIDSLYKTKYDSIVVANSNFLYSLVYDNTQKGQAKAQIMLQQAGVDTFEEITDLPTDEILENKSANISSINIENNENLFYIYPNPVNDILTVEYAILTGVSVNSIGIYDTKGVLLIKTPISESIGIVKINVSGLSKGNYFVSFGSDGINSYSKKFIVK